MGGQPVRIGVIGGGIWGNYHLRAARELEHEGKVQPVGIASKTEKNHAATPILTSMRTPCRSPSGNA